MDYDEDSTLTRYVCNHYQHLMTDFECITLNAILARQKSAMVPPNDPEMARIIGERFELIHDSKVNKALAQGDEAYRRQVRDRILNEHSDQVFINRCPQCHCIIRTPEAKLCLWCGHAWHDQS